MVTTWVHALVCCFVIFSVLNDLLLFFVSRFWISTSNRSPSIAPSSPVSLLCLHPEDCVFLFLSKLRLFAAFIITGMLASTLTPAKTHAIISIIFNSWHSVNPPFIRPTPWLQTITPHIWWMRTPDTIQKTVERTTKTYLMSALLYCRELRGVGKRTVWNIEWKAFCAQWKPV